MFQIAWYYEVISKHIYRRNGKKWNIATAPWIFFVNLKNCTHTCTLSCCFQTLVWHTQVYTVYGCFIITCGINCQITLYKEVILECFLCPEKENMYIIQIECRFFANHSPNNYMVRGFFWETSDFKTIKA